MYLWLFELDQRIQRLGDLLDDLQPWAEGKLSVRFLFPKGGVAKGRSADEGDRRYGRRPEIIRWKNNVGKDGQKSRRPSDHSSVTMYELVPPEKAKQSLKRHTVFAETHAEAKQVLDVLMELIKQRDELFKTIGDANRRYAIRLTYSKRRVAEIDHETEGWEEQVREIAYKSRMNRRKRALDTLANLEPTAGYTHEWTPVLPAGRDVDPRRRTV